MTLVEIIGNQAVRIAVLEEQLTQVIAANAELTRQLVKSKSGPAGSSPGPDDAGCG